MYILNLCYGLFASNVLLDYHIECRFQVLIYYNLGL